MARSMTADPDLKRKRVHRRRLVALLVALLVIIGVGGYQLISTHQAIAAQNVALAGAKKDLKKAKTEKTNLKVQIDQLKNSEYLAKLVRQRYWMSKKGETVFSLPTDTDQAGQ